jgi:hypothetical protein
VAMVLVRVAWCRCEPQAEFSWAAFEILSYQPFAVAVMPRPPASMQQGDRARSHRIGLHLSFRPWLARYCGAAERNAPARSQRDKNRLPRRASHGMNLQPRCAWFRIRPVKLPLTT